MFFPSKKDIWLTITLWLAAFLFIIPPIFFPDFGVWMGPDFLDKQWIKIALLTPLGFVVLWLWFKTGYTIEQNHIKIQYGPFVKRIKISDIHRMSETRNLFTGPALSMDKIQINYAALESIEISPINKIDFIRQVLLLNPEIKTDIQFKKG